MSLGSKFFLSYLVVVAIGLAVLAVSTATIAPETFSSRMQGMMMGNAGQGENNGYGPGGMMMGGPRGGNTNFQALDDDLNQSFRESVNSALLRAALAATVAAGVVSWLISRRIVRPLREMSTASRTIAAGHYDQRLPAPGNDELGELVHSFNSMAAALAETEAMRQQLIGDVSHELKTPLASIKGYMEGLQDGIIPPTPETFQLVHREADRLQRLVHDLQELSRAEAGSYPLARHACTPEALIMPVVERLRPQYADQAVTLTVDVPPDLPDVHADPDRIAQVLTNLLGNALQYTPEGGQVTVSAAVQGAMIRFAVQDSGVGLAADDLARIFQRFYRVDKSRARASGGSGVGLTIAQHFVTAHGGNLWAESPGVGYGSTFVFTLPCSNFTKTSH